MFRLLLILVLIFYVLYKLGLFRVMVTNARDGYQEGGNSSRRPADGNVNIDSVPKEKKKSTFKGGDYIDYEEVK